MFALYMAKFKFNWIKINIYTKAGKNAVRQNSHINMELHTDMKDGILTAAIVKNLYSCFFPPKTISWLLWMILRIQFQQFS